jgi:(p)ppGpp synthase/HD superfamily hydrolase
MNIEKAIEIALKAHANQLDKAGEPYILHPLRLAIKFDDRKLQIISILHDVIEDSAYTLSDLSAAGFVPEIISAIDALTKKDGEKYEDFINRVQKNTLAKKVKIEDLRDNLNIARLGYCELSDNDLMRINKYNRALIILTK